MRTSLVFLTSILMSLSALAQQTNETVEVSGTTRDYIMYKPTGFDPQTETLPLVFSLHGLGGNATQMTLTGMNSIADTARFIAIYPMGKTNSNNQSSWNNGVFGSSTANDVLFISKLIDETNQNIGIDLQRVYVCGLSMGGIMSFRLAIELNNRIAAIASMAGTMSTEDFQKNIPPEPTPMMQWHGTADNTVPYNGNGYPTLETVQPTINYWKDTDKCGASDSTIIPQPNTMSDGISVERIVYHTNTTSCDSAEVEHWKFTSGGHTWFNGQSNDVDGAKQFWLFFRDKKHDNPAPLATDSYESFDFKVYPNPADGPLKIESKKKIEQLKIYNASGQKVFQQKTNGQNFQINPNLKAGQYQVILHAGDQYSAQSVFIK